MIAPPQTPSATDNRARLAALLRTRLGAAGDWFPLSHGQEALWFLFKLLPHTGAYNMSFVAAIEGTLNLPAFERSWQLLCDRHPSLRMRFQEHQGEVRQQPIPAFQFQVELIDAPPDADFEALLHHESHQPFNLELSAAIRVQLVRRPAKQTVLLIVLPHIVGDLTSLTVVLEELRTLYTAEISGTPTTLPRLPITFADHVLHERRALDPDTTDRLWTYWRQQLAPEANPELPVLDLATDRPRPLERSFRGDSITHILPSALLHKLQALSEAHHVTLFMALLTAYQALLARYTGQPDIIIGTPAIGRTRPEVTEVVGDFVNMLPLRLTLQPTDTFETLLHTTRSQVADALRHQQLPFSMMVSRLHLPPDLSRTPIFQTSFALQRLERFPELARSILSQPGEPPIPFADLQLHPLPLTQQEGQYDLNVEAKLDETGALVMAWKFSTDLFNPSTIHRIAHHFETLLTNLIESPHSPVASLPLLTPNQTAEEITLSAAPLLTLPEAASVVELFEAQALLTPNATAIVSGVDSITYTNLSAQVQTLAARFAAHGIGPETIVPVLLPRGISFITTLLALSKAGAAFFPADPRHPFTRAALIQTPFVFTDPAHRTIDSRAITLDDLPPATTSALPRPLPKSLAYIMLTSGSTGVPKGVMVEHLGMINHCLAKLNDLGITARDRVAQTGPQSFDIVVWQCLAPLIVGAQVVVLPDDIAENPAELLAAIDRDSITILQVVPSMLTAILDVAESGAPAPLTTLRWIVPTGDALPTALCTRWLAVYPGIPILNTYGSTECSDDQCHYTLPSLSAADHAVSVASIGTPIANMAAYVLDDNLAPVPPGIPGELYVGGIGVGRGYFNSPTQTATAFIPDPFSKTPGARLYRTRDRVRRRADGAIDFLGRTDHMIKLRGFRIEPREIETALCRHSDITQAAVLLRPDPSGEPRLVAFYVASSVPEDLAAWLDQRLPRSMVPDLLHRIDALPINSSGKLDRKRLPEPEWAARTPRAFVPPTTPAEHTLALIWSEVLKLPSIGITEDFFSLGGDSIRSIQIVARARAAGLALEPADLIRYRTIEAIAARQAKLQTPAQHQPSVPEADILPEFSLPAEHLAIALQQIDFGHGDS